MTMAEDQLAELKHAYQVLGAPLFASASSIRQIYRKLVKRWPPDLYASVTPAYAEATQMTKLINAAYSAIKTAPLRYYIEACPPAPSSEASKPHVGRQMSHWGYAVKRSPKLTGSNSG